MSLHESGHDDQHQGYLLGPSEEDAERLDEASITDDEVAGRLRVVENDLVDAYERQPAGNRWSGSNPSIFLRLAAARR